MKKNWLVAAIISCVTMPAASQTLFTYGKYKADASEFLRTFNKSVPPPEGNKAAAIRDYLDTYIAFRLKIAEAYERGYDTLASIRYELDNLRNQVIETYLSDPVVIDRLTREAFQRSLKDIHTAHIFIAVNAADTLAGYRKLGEVVKRLKSGEDFGTVAQQFSDDPEAKNNKGDLSYITVFTLPYELENIVYSTAAGATSAPYRSAAGYHIFKNLGERKALGKIKIQQILIAFPPDADETGRKMAARLADSLYLRIKAGDDFGKLAQDFSNDYISAASNGNVPDITVGQYAPDFEKTIWALPANGVSKPLLTSHGYHIVKRTGSVPVVTDPADAGNLDILKQKVQADDRWKSARDFIYARVQTIFRPVTYREAVLWALTDSLLDQKPGAGTAMNSGSALFHIGNTGYNVAGWIDYARANRYRPGTKTAIPYAALMDDFIKSSMYEYYRDHLEDFNKDFRVQMNEFREGNLFFEIMQHEVWDKVQNDSLALLELYEKDKAKYAWKPGADAVIFYCADLATAKAAAAQVKKNPAAWSTIVAGNEKISIDSGRYKWPDIMGLEKPLPAGTVTVPVVNPSQNTASFAYIIRVYTQPSPRPFEEAKGDVMNDYQLLVQEEWVKELRKKYPVVIDPAVLAQIEK